MLCLSTQVSVLSDCEFSGGQRLVFSGTVGNQPTCFHSRLGFAADHSQTRESQTTTGVSIWIGFVTFDRPVASNKIKSIGTRLYQFRWKTDTGDRDHWTSPGILRMDRYYTG